MAGRLTADAGLAQPCVIDLGAGQLRAWLRSRIYWNGASPEWACLYRGDSFDAGRNWSVPQRTAIQNNSSFQLTRLANGWLALVYNHQRAPQRSPLNIALSADNGNSWFAGRELEPYDTSGAEYSYPSIAQTADGLLHIAYTWRRTHIRHVCCSLEWIAQGNTLPG